MGSNFITLEDIVGMRDGLEGSTIQKKSMGWETDSNLETEEQQEVEGTEIITFTEFTFFIQPNFVFMYRSVRNVIDRSSWQVYERNTKKRRWRL